MNNDIPPPNTVLRLERIMEKLAACRAAKGDNNQPGPDIYVTAAYFVRKY